MNETFQIETVSKTNEGIDLLEKLMLDELEPAIEELEHTFTDRIYSRKWIAKAGTLWVTRKHLIQHQFVILKGTVSVWIDGVETVYEAPYNGVTEIGTRRVLYVWEDTEWITFHPHFDNLSAEEMVESVTEKHDNKLFSSEDENLLKSIRVEIKQRYLTN
jgi:hypothetical protein